jgi:hypothetical protein
MHLVVILGVLHVEVVDPTKFTVDVSLLGKFGVVWHARSFHIVLLIWVKLALRVQQDPLLQLEILVKVLLQQYTIYSEQSDD